MDHRIAVYTFALMLFSAPLSCAELFYLDHDPVTDQYLGPVGPLVISGEIMPGDYDRLVSKICEDEKRFLALNKLILASDGGDVTEAMKIAALVKSLFTGVVVGPLTGRCVSACFFIYAAAAQREADGERLIGINRPFIVDADADAASASRTDAASVENGALDRVRAFLQASEVPDYLVDEMFRHASDDAYWLSADDEKNLGYRSQAFQRYLWEKCAWDDGVEREVYAGKRPIDDLKQMLECRDRVTRHAAHQALILASKRKLH